MRQHDAPQLERNINAMANVSQNEKKFNPCEHLMQLKGKDYLQVMWRLVWFREEHPNWGIETGAINVDEKGALFYAHIYDENGNLLSSGHGSETPKDFGDYIEKAETKAVGRSLAMLGYGTQFTADEMDEGNRIVDSPVDRKPKKTEPKPEPKDDAPYYKCSHCGQVLTPHIDEGGNEYGITRIAELTKKRCGKVLCWDCAVNAKNGAQNG